MFLKEKKKFQQKKKRKIKQQTRNLICFKMYGAINATTPKVPKYKISLPNLLKNSFSDGGFGLPIPGIGFIFQTRVLV